MNARVMSLRLLAAVCGVGLAAVLQAGEGNPQQSPGWAAALQQLQVGHARYLCGKPDRPNGTAQRREETAKGQHPFAVVLSCADSRLPVEMIFDQGIGDVFTIRVAGNVADKSQVGSIEYAVEHLHTPLVVVMGHRGCGAVAAACSKAELHGALAAVVDPIRPAVDRAERSGARGDGLLDEAIKSNVWVSIENLLGGSAAIRDAVAGGNLRVIGAVYDIHSGAMNWLGTHPDEGRLLSAPQPGKDDGRADAPRTAVAGAQAVKEPGPADHDHKDAKAEIQAPHGGPKPPPPAKPAFPGGAPGKPAEKKPAEKKPAPASGHGH